MEQSRAPSTTRWKRTRSKSYSPSTSISYWKCRWTIRTETSTSRPISFFHFNFHSRTYWSTLKIDLIYLFLRKNRCGFSQSITHVRSQKPTDQTSTIEKARGLLFDAKWSLKLVWLIEGFVPILCGTPTLKAHSCSFIEKNKIGDTKRNG